MYSQEEVTQEATKYFDNSLAGDVWTGKYALKTFNKEGVPTYYEKTPDDMHRRHAREFARIESNYGGKYTEQEIYEALKKWILIPQGSPSYGIGNPYIRSSLGNCFTKGTQILTQNRGIINIEDAQVGDEVVTHINNIKRVTRTFQNPLGGRKVYALKVFRTPEIKVTENHNFWSITQEQLKWGESPQWNSVDKLREGDFIAIPKYEGSNEEKSIILDKILEKVDTHEKTYWLNDNSQLVFKTKNREHNPINNQWKIDENFAFFLGLWYGNGCVFNRDNKNKDIIKGITFTFNKKSIESIRFTEEYGSKLFGVKADVNYHNIEKDGNVQVAFYSYAIGKVFEVLFGRGFSGKRLNSFMFNWNTSLVESLLSGLISSDGTVTDSGDVRVVLSNKKLVKEFFMLARRAGVPLGYCESEKNCARIDLPKRSNLLNKIQKNYSDDRITDALSKEESIFQLKVINGVTFMKIKKKIPLVNFSDDYVYTMEVEDDHSYTVEGLVCQNCYVLSSPRDSMSSIFDTAKNAANLYKFRAGVGCDLSLLRPEGMAVDNPAGTTSGAWSFSKFYSFVTGMVGQNGRRGALLLSLSCKHPDVYKFAEMKSLSKEIEFANVSVMVTNDFMRAIKNDTEWTLQWPVDVPVEKATITRVIRARHLWDFISEKATKTGDPGILFYDNYAGNVPLHYYPGFKSESTNPSLRENTLVLTHEGVFPIRQLAEERPLTKVLNARKEWRECKVFKSGENKQLYKIKFQNGQEVFCTPEHKWPVLNSTNQLYNKYGKVIKKETRNLRAGNKIYFPEIANPINNPSCKLEEWDGFFSGWFYGDGWQSYHKANNAMQIGFSFSEEDKAIGERMVIFTNSLSLKPSSLKKDHDCNSYTYCTTDINVRNYAEKLCLDNKEKGLPKNIWTSNAKFIKGFIDGLFSTDGSVYIEKKLSDSYIVLVTSREKIASDTQKLLSFYGIKSNVRKSIAKKINFPNGKNYEKEYIRYDLKISGINIRKFAKNFLLSNKRKQEKINSILNMNINRENKRTSYANSREYLVITEVILTDIYEDVYDITVFDDTHTFITEVGLTGNCGELMLSGEDSCRLLIENLKKIVRDPFTSSARIDWDFFDYYTRFGMRLMDDMIDLEIERLSSILEKSDDPSEIKLWTKIIQTAEEGRRTGFGHLGLGDMLSMLRIPYNSQEAVDTVEEVYKFFKETSYRESIEMAKERGAFPIYNTEIDEQCPFIQRLPDDIKSDMRKYGRRNGALLTVAPTGSMSLLAKEEGLPAGSSSGIEPVFSFYYVRKKVVNPEDKTTIPDEIEPGTGRKWKKYAVLHPNVLHYFRLNPEKEEQFKKVQETLPEEKWAGELRKILPEYFITAPEIDPEDRIKVQAALTRHLDHNSSSTINLPKGTTVERVREIYEKAWDNDLKGITIYVDGCKDISVLNNIEETQKNSGKFIRRPKELPCDIHNVTVDGHKWTILVGLMNEQPYEVFGGLSENINIEGGERRGAILKRKLSKPINDVSTVYDLNIKDGMTVSDIVSAFDNPVYAFTTRLISLELREGVELQYIVDALAKGSKKDHLNSFPKVLSRIIKKYIKDGTKSSLVCSKCEQNALVFEEGCMICKNCGNSKCG